MPPKLELSPDEWALAQNAEFILTKNRIIRHVIDLFSSLAGSMQAELAGAVLPEAIKATSPKISKGEQYKGMPYVMLDYPRLFSHENIFAIRTLFWWGHFFSITLHLKGLYKQLFSSSVREHLLTLAMKEFFICDSASEWQHDLRTEEYIPLEGLNATRLDSILREREFLKLTRKIDLAEGVNPAGTLQESFVAILRSLQ